MPSHRLQDRRRGVRPDPDGDGRLEPLSARSEAVEEGLVPNVDRLPKPAGFGLEASRSAQSFATIDSYTVPDGAVALVEEVAVSIEANGEAKVSTPNVTYGPFTGAADVSVPLEKTVLPPGYQIRVLHQSTDGTSTTTRAQVVVSEV